MSKTKSPDIKPDVDYTKLMKNYETVGMECNRIVKESAVSHPNHYTFGNIEVIDYLRDKLSHDQFTGFCLGNVLKYVSRWEHKDGVQDLKKAQQYLTWAIEWVEKDNSKKKSNGSVSKMTGADTDGDNLINMFKLPPLHHDLDGKRLKLIQDPETGNMIFVDADKVENTEKIADKAMETVRKLVEINGTNEDSYEVNANETDNITGRSDNTNA